MHPVLRRTGELSKLQFSELFPSTIRSQTKQCRTNPAHHRWGDLGARGCRIPWIRFTRGQTGVNRCENFFTLCSILFLWPSWSGLSGVVANRCRKAFKACRFFPVNSRRLLEGNFRPNVARSFSQPVVFPGQGRTGSRQLPALMRDRWGNRSKNFFTPFCISSGALTGLRPTRRNENSRRRPLVSGGPRQGKGVNSRCPTFAEDKLRGNGAPRMILR